MVHGERGGITYIDLIQGNIERLGEALLGVGVGLVLLLVVRFEDVVLLLGQARLDVTRHLLGQAGIGVVEARLCRRIRWYAVLTLEVRMWVGVGVVSVDVLGSNEGHAQCRCGRRAATTKGGCARALGFGRAVQVVARSANLRCVPGVDVDATSRQHQFRVPGRS